MSIRAVIWDFGGVLVRMVDETPRRQLAARLGTSLKTLYHLVFDSDSARRGTLGEITIDQHWEAIRQDLNVQPDSMPAIIEQFWAADGIDEDLVAYIASLRHTYTTGLLSNAWSDLRSVLTNRLKVAHLFDDMVISAEVGLAKPDPRIYHLVVQRLGVAPDEAVFFDDNAENIAAACEAGLLGFVYTDLEQARTDLNKAVAG